MTQLLRDHAPVFWKRKERATLEDVIEFLQGIGTILMKIDSKPEEVVRHLEEEDDGEAEP